LSCPLCYRWHKTIAFDSDTNVEEKYNPNFNGAIIIGSDNGFEESFILACSTANLYLNCVVSYEILVLLRNSNQLITHKPPSLSRVTLQTVGVYSFSIIVFIIHYFIERKAIERYKKFVNIDDENDIKYYRLSNANMGWSILITYVFPIVFFFYIWITIKCRGYMPSVTESTKQLVWFFFRIVFVFCLIWLPGMALVVVGINEIPDFYEGRFLQMGSLFCGLQPIVSTCMTMTKVDVRKYTLKVVTLSYISPSLSSSASYIRTSLSSGVSYIRTSLPSRTSYIRTSLYHHQAEQNKKREIIAD